MLAQRWGRCPDRRRALGILDRRVDHLDWPALAVVHLHDHVAGPRVLVVQGPLHVVNGGVGHALALEDIEPFLRRLSNGESLDFVFQLVPVGDSLRIDRVLGVRLPLWSSDAIAEDTKEPVVATAQKDIPVLRLERLVWDDGS